MTALPGAEVYDDPVFFAGYQRMRAAQTGLNEELEQRVSQLEAKLGGGPSSSTQD